MGITAEQEMEYRNRGVDNGTGLKTMLARLGQSFVPLPQRIFIPGISESREDPIKDSTKMLLAMAATGQKIYEGTVPSHVRAQRRRRNKAARAARRVHRR